MHRHYEMCNMHYEICNSHYEICNMHNEIIFQNELTNMLLNNHANEIPKSIGKPIHETNATLGEGSLLAYCSKCPSDLQLRMYHPCQWAVQWSRLGRGRAQSVMLACRSVSSYLESVAPS